MHKVPFLYSDMYYHTFSLANNLFFFPYNSVKLQLKQEQTLTKMFSQVPQQDYSLIWILTLGYIKVPLTPGRIFTLNSDPMLLVIC